MHPRRHRDRRGRSTSILSMQMFHRALRMVWLLSRGLQIPAPGSNWVAGGAIPGNLRVKFAPQGSNNDMEIDSYVLAMAAGRARRSGLCHDQRLGLSTAASRVSCAQGGGRASDSPRCRSSAGLTLEHAIWRPTVVSALPPTTRHPWVSCSLRDILSARLTSDGPQVRAPSTGTRSDLLAWRVGRSASHGAA